MSGRRSEAILTSGFSQAMIPVKKYRYSRRVKLEDLKPISRARTYAAPAETTPTSATLFQTNSINPKILILEEILFQSNRRIFHVQAEFLPMPVYYTCPDCGYQQRSEAQKRVKCHSCGRSYLKRDAKKTEKKTPEKGEETGFKKYKKKD